MFDIWLGRINLTVLMVVVSVAVVLPAQLLLCFRVRSRRLRCMPAIILCLAAAADVVMYIAVSGWKRTVYVFGAGYMVLMLFMCGAGWGIWLLIKKKEEARRDEKSDADPAG